MKTTSKIKMIHKIKGVTDRFTHQHTYSILDTFRILQALQQLLQLQPNYDLKNQDKLESVHDGKTKMTFKNSFPLRLCQKYYWILRILLLPHNLAVTQFSEHLVCIMWCSEREGIYRFHHLFFHVFSYLEHFYLSVKN